MQELYAFLIKLATIFIGSGIVSLFAYVIAKELNKMSMEILYNQKYFNNNCLNLINQKKLDSNSAYYELSYKNNKNIKIFSTPNSIRII